MQKVKIFCLPSYKIKLNEVKANTIIVDDIKKFNHLLSEEKESRNLCFHEEIRAEDLIKLNVDIDGTNIPIEDIYNYIMEALNDIFELENYEYDYEIDVNYTQNYSYSKGGNSHHIVINGISCTAKTQIKFWRYIEQKYPELNFKFDTGHLSSSRKWYRLPHQNKESVPNTAHKVLYGESCNFVLHYTQECTDFTEEIDLLYDDTIKVKKVKENTEEEINYDVEKIREFAELIDMKYLDQYEDWLKILFAMRAIGENVKEIARNISQKSTKYNEKSFNNTWRQYQKHRYKKIGVNTFFNYCKISNEKQFTELCKKYSHSQIEYSQVSKFFELDLTHIQIKTETSKYIGCNEQNIQLFDYNLHLFEKTHRIICRIR